MADTPETPSVQSQVDPSSGKLGDVLTLTIKVTHPNGFIVEAPVFQKSLGNFEIYASTQLPAELKGPEQVQRYVAQLQNFTTGQQLLPGIELTYHDLMGKPHSMQTPSAQVTIEEVPPGPKDKGDIRGIRGPIGPIAWSPWWWVLLGLAVVGLGVLLWQRRRRVLEGPPPPPPVPADESALKKLRELQEGDWIASGKIKEFYIALSDILRAYLEDGFRIPALERTTNELMRDVRKRATFGPDRMLELKNFLEDCDLVKFAKFRPEADQALQDHAVAVRFVEETRAVIARKLSSNSPRES